MFKEIGKDTISLESLQVSVFLKSRRMLRFHSPYEMMVHSELAN